MQKRSLFGAFFWSVAIIVLFLCVIFLPGLIAKDSTTIDHETKIHKLSQDTVIKSNNRKQNASKKSKKKGLYASSNNLVAELGPKFMEEEIEDGVHIIVVYYAAWCPHCATYAPTFMKYADLYSKDYDTVFAAVDCAEYESQCDKMKITSYPTVVAFNFPKDSKSVTSAFGSIVDSRKIKAYLLTNGVKRKGESVKIDTSELGDAKENNTGSRQHLLAWIQTSVEAKARIASPEERLGDALSSLEYLLLSESPRLVVGNSLEAKRRRGALVQLVQVVTSVLPTNIKLLKPNFDLVSARKWIFEHSNDADTLTEKEWKQGLQAALHPQTKSKRPGNLRNSKSSSDTTPGIIWRVCGVSTNSESQTASVDKGYTCGLWLLMHFLTVAGNTPRDDVSSLRAETVQSSIRSLVSELFTCSSCRKHFMKAYDDCSYSRCSNSSSEGGEEDGGSNVGMAYPRMQLWLFRLHNAVTTRIYQEKSVDIGSVAEDFRKVIWPSDNVDLGATGKYMVDPSRVLSYVREVYWDEKKWGPLSPLPKKSSIDRLLDQNSK